MEQIIIPITSFDFIIKFIIISVCGLLMILLCRHLAKKSEKEKSVVSIRRKIFSYIVIGIGVVSIISSIILSFTILHPDLSADKLYGLTIQDRVDWEKKYVKELKGYSAEERLQAFKDTKFAEKFQSREDYNELTYLTPEQRDQLYNSESIKEKLVTPATHNINSSSHIVRKSGAKLIWGYPTFEQRVVTTSFLWGFLIVAWGVYCLYFKSENISFIKKLSKILGYLTLSAAFLNCVEFYYFDSYEIFPILGLCILSFVLIKISSNKREKNNAIETTIPDVKPDVKLKTKYYFKFDIRRISKIIGKVIISFFLIGSYCFAVFEIFLDTSTDGFHIIVCAIISLNFLFVLWHKRYKLSWDNILLKPFLVKAKAFKNILNPQMISRRLTIIILPTITVSFLLYGIADSSDDITDSLLFFSMIIWIISLLALYIVDRLNKLSPNNININIFDYVERTECVRRFFTDEEKIMIKSSTVISSDDGLKVEFMMNDGSVSYIILNTASTLKTGDLVDVNLAVLVILKKKTGVEVSILI